MAVNMKNDSKEKQGRGRWKERKRGEGNKKRMSDWGGGGGEAWKAMEDHVERRRRRRMENVTEDGKELETVDIRKCGRKGENRKGEKTL
jgi:hypothetical protein